MPPKKRRRSQHTTEKGAGPNQAPSASQAKDCIVHWLLKSEPESRIENGVDMKFSIDDLIQCPESTSCWDGVRNYQARNIMRDQMKIGHQCFFYHSNCKVPGIVGIVEVVKESYPDHTQFDKNNNHYDRTSSADNPRWFMVDVKFVRKLDRQITLAELKELHEKHKSQDPKGPLANMALVARSRLSVQPVTEEEWDFILKLEELPQNSK
ncbi:thymocyte nuclear protein 1-like isoform X1 [Haemaphysalis longicornis]